MKQIRNFLNKLHLFFVKYNIFLKATNKPQQTDRQFKEKVTLYRELVHLDNKEFEPMSLQFFKEEILGMTHYEIINDLKEFRTMKRNM